MLTLGICARKNRKSVPERAEIYYNSSNESSHQVFREHTVTHHAMKSRSCQLFIPLICIFAIVQSLTAQEPKAAKRKQFIYVLRLVQRLHADSAWTKEDNAVLQRHFVRFQEAAKSGQLVLAGRTSEPGDKTFGIAIFEAADEHVARKFMQEDPAVAGGLMTVELHPFAVALQRKNP
jgi:uncharacterized protein YciI